MPNERQMVYVPWVGERETTEAHCPGRWRKVSEPWRLQRVLPDTVMNFVIDEVSEVMLWSPACIVLLSHSKSWWPCERVMPTVSCPQQSCSAPIEGCPYQIWSSCFLLPSVSPSTTVFSQEPCLLTVCPTQVSRIFIELELLSSTKWRDLALAHSYPAFHKDFQRQSSLHCNEPIMLMELPRNNRNCVFLWFGSLEAR